MLNISGLIDTIIREITINSSKQIVIREDAILDKLLAEKNRKSKQWGYFIQILLLTFFIVGFLYVFASIVLFFIFNVILFEPELSATRRGGAVVITQPCGVEQIFFIHNTANMWADSGIDVVKGDIIEVSYSGSFYSTVRDLSDASIYSQPIKYQWAASRRIRSEKTDTNLLKYCVYNRCESDTGYIGSLLMKIGISNELSNSIFQVDNRKSLFKIMAKSSGTLFFTVNDIFIEDTAFINKMMKDTIFSNNQKKEIIKRLEFKNNGIKTALIDYIDNGEYGRVVDTINTKSPLWNAKNIWYDDNIGELLVNVRITRSHLHSSNPLDNWLAKIYRSIETTWASLSKHF